MYYFECPASSEGKTRVKKLGCINRALFDQITCLAGCSSVKLEHLEPGQVCVCVFAHEWLTDRYYLKLTVTAKVNSVSVRQLQIYNSLCLVFPLIDKHTHTLWRLGVFESCSSALPRSGCRLAEVMRTLQGVAFLWWNESRGAWVTRPRLYSLTGCGTQEQRIMSSLTWTDINSCCGEEKQTSRDSVVLIASCS